MSFRGSNQLDTTLQYLLWKTAAVRRGIKPGELLRLIHGSEHHCNGTSATCGQMRENLRQLRLPFVVLREDPDALLVLFYTERPLAATLKRPGNRAILDRFGYPPGNDLEQQFAKLRQRFAATAIPHEVGVFLGYPPQDIEGFLAKRPSVSFPGARWRTFGASSVSRLLMQLHRQAEEQARVLLAETPDLETFFNLVLHLKFSLRLSS